MLETGDKEVIEVITRCCAVHYDGDALVACAGLVLERGRYRRHQSTVVQWFSFAVGPPIHIGEVWLILPTKQNSRLLMPHKRPKAGRCLWTKGPGTVLLPERRCWLCLALYLGYREGDVGMFWLIILLG